MKEKENFLKFYLFERIKRSKNVNHAKFQNVFIFKLINSAKERERERKKYINKRRVITSRKR